MLILKMTSPSGQAKFFTGAFPSACRQDQSGDVIPTIEGWKVETVGDDIAWMNLARMDGSTRLIRSMAFWSGAGNEHEIESECHAHRDQEFDLHELRHHARPRRLVGRDDGREAPSCWTGCGGMDSHSPRKAAHPNARFTTPARQCPVIAPSGKIRKACRLMESCLAAEEPGLYLW